MSTNSVRKEQALTDFESEFDRMFGDYSSAVSAPPPAPSPAATPAIASVAATTVVLPTRPVLREATMPAAAAPAKPVFSDPLLAELARIVGNGPAPRAAQPVQSAPQPSRQADPLAAFEEELRRFDELHRSNLASARPQAVESVPVPVLAPVQLPLAETQLDLRGATPDPAGVQPVTQYQPDAVQAAPAEIAYQEPVVDYVPPPEDQPVVERPRARRVVALLGSAAAIAVVGLVGAVAMKAKGPGISGEPPVIAAMKQPLKEKPTDPGGVEIPGQDRQVLAKGSSDPKGQATVLNKEEQPVDLAQTPKRDVARVVLPAPGSNAPAGATVPIIMPPPGTVSAPAATASVPPPQPKVEPPAVAAGGFEAKRVRSVKVGPEGDTLPVPAPSAVPVSPSATIAAAPIPTVAPTAPQSTATVTPPKAASTPATTPVAQPKSEARPAAAVRAQTPQAPARVAARTAPEAAEEPANGATPLSLRPPSGASPTRAVPQTASAAPASGGQKGGFAVQLAASPSEADARSTAARLKQSAALSGYSPTWKTSEVNGRTVYRVRVSNLSRETANELCGKVKAGGGSCFVAGN